MANPLFTPDGFLIFIGICETLSLLSTSLIVLRLITVAISFTYVAVSLWAGLANPGVKSILVRALMDLALNGTMIGLFFYGRSVRSVPVEWRAVFQSHFQDFAPYEFKTLRKAASVLEPVEAVQEAGWIARQGSPFEALYLLLAGTASVMVDGTSKGWLRPGDWIAEMSFLTGRPMSADVEPKGARLLRWDRAALDDLAARHPDLLRKLQGRLAENVCEKLIRSNTRQVDASDDAPGCRAA